MGKNLSVYLNDDDCRLFEKSGLTIGQLVSTALKAYNNDSYKVHVKYYRSSKLREQLLVSGIVAPVRLIEKTFDIVGVSQDVIDYAKSKGLFYAENCTYTYPHRSIESFGIFLDQAIVRYTAEQDQDIDEFTLTVDNLKLVQAQYEAQEAKEKEKKEQEQKERELRQKEREEKEKELLRKYEAREQEKTDAVNNLISKLNFTADNELKVISESEYKAKFIEQLVFEYLEQSGLKMTYLYGDFTEIDGIDSIGIKKAREAILARQKIEGLLSKIELISYEFNSFVKDDTGVLGYEYKIELFADFKEHYIFIE